ncbi:hypothetical protein ACSMXN_01930 [Jatrophihabitans sp. DSM 45814]
MVTTVTLADSELRPVVRAAATLVPKVAHLVERCTTEADPGSELAMMCGKLASAHVALQTQLARLPRTPLVEQVDCLINNQLKLVTQASALAFRPRSSGWYRLAAQFGEGWGDPADELIRLAARL